MAVKLELNNRGEWIHDGTVLRHRRMCALLHRSIARDDAGGLVVTTGRDVLPIQCHDTPFFIIDVRTETDDTIILRLSDDSEEILTTQGLHYCDDNRFRVRVKNGCFWALAFRGVHEFFQNRLVAVEPETSSDDLVLSLDGRHTVSTVPVDPRG